MHEQVLLPMVAKDQVQGPSELVDDDVAISLKSLFDDDRQIPPPFPLRPLAAPPGCIVPLHQDARDALGGRVWKASIFLKQWLEQKGFLEKLRGLAILDVGAGIGALGLACALARPFPPAFVAVTDKSSLLALLRRNVEVARERAATTGGHVPIHIPGSHRKYSGGMQGGISGREEERGEEEEEGGEGEGGRESEGGQDRGREGSCHLVACPLDWMERGHGSECTALIELLHAKTGKKHFDMILAADCVYYPHLYQPLVETLAAMAGENTRVVIANDEGRTDARGVEALAGRRWDEGFFEVFARWFVWGEEEREGEERGGEDRMYPAMEEGGGGPFRVVVARKREGRDGVE